MPRIEQSLTIAAPVETVYSIARDVEKFPDFMSELQSLKIVESTNEGNRTVTEWVALVPQFAMKLKWQQEDIWDPSRHRDDFKALKGDVDKMEGYWQFTFADGVTTFDSVVDYEVNVPLVGPLVKNLIRKLMESNLAAQMNAIKLEAEKA
ncbi:MAG: SRPBCC family protein [Chthonomonadales bacterium]